MNEKLSNPALLEWDQKAEAEQKKQHEDDLAAVLASAEGRRLLFHFMAKMGVNGNPFSPNGSQQSFNCGQLAGGQMIYDEVVALDHKKYLQMFDEYEAAKKMAAQERAIHLEKKRVLAQKEHIRK